MAVETAALPPTEPGLPARLERWALAAAHRPLWWLAACVLVLGVQLSGCWYTSLDGGAYISAARRMASGEAVSRVAHGVLPGYPLLITPLFWFGDRPFLAISVLHLLLSIAYLAGVYHWARRLAPTAAVWIAAIAVVNTGFGIYYRRTLKEVAFMAVLVWTVNALHALLASRTKPRMAAWGLGALLLLAFLTSIRLTGVVLTFGLLLAALFASGLTPEQRRRRWWFAGGVGIAGIGLMVLLVASGRQAYWQGFEFGSLASAERLADGILTRISDVGRVSLPGMYKAYARPGEWLNINVLVYSAFFALLAAGWVQLVRRRADVWALSLPFYFGLYVIWPYSQGARFFVCMAPVLAVCAWYGLARLSRWRHALFALSALAHCGASLGYWVAVDAPRARQAQNQWLAVDELADVLRHDEEAVCVAPSMTDTHAMLQLSLERRVEWHEADESVPEKAVWYVQPSSQKLPPPGFAVHAAAGELLLLRRAGKPPDRGPVRTASRRTNLGGSK